MLDYLSSIWNEQEVAQVVKRHKKISGTDLLIMGSGTLVQQLSNADLIDEYFLIVTPVILGWGKPLFKSVEEIHLQLKETQHFNSGNVLLHYARPTAA
jgi:dihydrofolate reductase